MHSRSFNAIQTKLDVAVYEEYDKQINSSITLTCIFETTPQHNKILLKKTGGRMGFRGSEISGQHSLEKIVTDYIFDYSKRFGLTVQEERYLTLMKRLVMGSNSTEWTVLKMLKWAAAYFEEKGISNPRLSIEWLLAVLQKKRLDLYLIYDRPLSREELDFIKPMIKEGRSMNPYNIYLETLIFWDYLKVSPDVFIPRPETEELVDWVYKILSLMIHL